MNKYELAIVLKPAVGDEGAKEEFAKIQALIERFGGTIDKVDEWGKRRLAYEIDKLNEGYYYFITFLSESEAPAEIESRLRIEEEVLRYLFIRLDDRR